MRQTSKKKILLSKPQYFSVEYVINPWMKVGSVDKNKAQQQWERLAKTYRDLEVEIMTIEPVAGLPDMVFTADEAIVVGQRAYLSHFRYPQRQPETEVFRQWFQKHGYDPIDIDRADFFEGGECVPWRNLLFVGTGFRAQKEICPKLENLLWKRVVGLELINKYFYHLDTCLFALNDDVVFYYPPAFSHTSLKQLQKLVPRLIPLIETEAKNFVANAVVLGHTVLTTPANSRFTEHLHELGYNTRELEMSEFQKSGGGIHCLSLALN